MATNKIEETMKKPVILHVIVDLRRGGAENHLVQLLDKLTGYNHYVVTLRPGNSFKNKIAVEELFCLNADGYSKLPLAVFRFRKLLKKIRPDIVHSQLTLANTLVRMATPRRLPTFTSIQNSVKYNVEFRTRFIRALEKLSLMWNPAHLIFVSDSVKNDYFELFPTAAKISHSVLHNFVDVSVFAGQQTLSPDTEKAVRLVTVGSLSPQKNLQFMVEAFLSAETSNATLDIYGEGPERSQLEALIEGHEEKIRLMGLCDNISGVLKNYDVYVSTSLYEGFSLSVLEAMAAKLPLLVSDIPSFREQCSDFATYYRSHKKQDFIEKLHHVIANLSAFSAAADDAFEYVSAGYSIEEHIRKLKVLYNSVLPHERESLKTESAFEDTAAQIHR